MLLNDLDLSCRLLIGQGGRINVIRNGNDYVFIVGVKRHDPGLKLLGHVLRVPDHLVLPPPVDQLLVLHREDGVPSVIVVLWQLFAQSGKSDLEFWFDSRSLREAASCTGERGGHPSCGVGLGVQLGEHLVLDVLPVPDDVVLPVGLGHHVERVCRELNLGRFPILS